MRLRDICWLILGLAVGIAIRAGMAGDVAIEYGQCRFGQSGAYMDRSMEHHNYMTPRCASIAWSDRFSSSQWGYRVAYIASGAIEGRDNDALLNDGQYYPQPCSDEFFANCTAKFGGAGRMRGISVSLTKDFSLPYGLTLRGESGLLFFEHYFNGYAKPVNFSGVTASTWFGGTPQKIEGAPLNQRSNMWSSPPTPMLGVSLHYRSVYVAARYYLPATHRTLSLTDHSFTQLVGGLLWSF